MARFPLSSLCKLFRGCILVVCMDKPPKAIVGGCWRFALDIWLNKQPFVVQIQDGKLQGINKQRPYTQNSRKYRRGLTQDTFG